MKKIISVAAAAALSISTVGAALADSPYYKLKSVIDGDTIKVESAQTDKLTTVRLACIDAPEKGQAGFEFSKQLLQSLLSEVQALEIRTDPKANDKYGRLIAEVYYEKDSQFFLLNQQLIAGGAAMYYEKYAKNSCEENKSVYEQAEAGAKKSQVGIWSPPAFPPMTPELFRKFKRFMNI